MDDTRVHSRSKRARVDFFIILFGPSSHFRDDPLYLSYEHAPMLSFLSYGLLVLSLIEGAIPVARAYFVFVLLFPFGDG